MNSHVYVLEDMGDGEHDPVTPFKGHDFPVYISHFLTCPQASQHTRKPS